MSLVAHEQSRPGPHQSLLEHPTVRLVLYPGGHGEVAVLIVPTDHDAARVDPGLEFSGSFGVGGAGGMEGVDEGCCGTEPFFEFSLPVQQDVDGTHDEGRPGSAFLGVGRVLQVLITIIELCFVFVFLWVFLFLVSLFVIFVRTVDVDDHTVIGIGMFTPFASLRCLFGCQCHCLLLPFPLENFCQLLLLHLLDVHTPLLHLRPQIHHVHLHGFDPALRLPSQCVILLLVVVVVVIALPFHLGGQ
mmetsp:Transcript_18543/g.18771  ORF Transcript_18543/g.18771 Transcript_18543/m.18771 type:complete len:245 (+) Transcript_18543:597-1331(+)